MTFEKLSERMEMSEVMRRIFVMQTKISMSGGPSFGEICEPRSQIFEDEGMQNLIVRSH